MKQKIFTLIMMFALVIVASSAFAQNVNDRLAPEDSVKVNSTGSYSLSGIVVNEEGTLTIGYSGDDATIQTVNLAAASPGPGYVVPTGSQTLTFDIVFGPAATSGTITVIVTDGATNGCENRITLGITVFPEPAIDLALAVTTGDSLFCQTTNGTLNNVAASVNSRDSIQFTVTPSIEHAPTSYTYDYSLSVVGTGLTGLSVIKVSGPGTYATGNVTDANSTTPAVFRVRWTTTTGQAQIPLIVTAGAATLTDDSAGGNSEEYDEEDTDNNDDAIQVKSTPSIGTFQ